jgi:hypothetical protein
MSERNPFDDASTPCGSPPQSPPKAQPKSFSRAQAEANKALNETAVKIHEAPPQVLPELITGEDYDQLEPQSLGKVQQDLLDDARFATITEAYCADTGKIGIVDLPTHQERLRAYKAKCRQLPNPETYEDLDEKAENWADDSTRRANKRKLKNRSLVALLAWCLFCFVSSTISTGNPAMGFIVAFVMFWMVIGAMNVLGLFMTMGDSAGRAV